MLKGGGPVSVGDLIAIFILFLAYVLTWILFCRSLKIIRIIEEEKLSALDRIKERLLKRKRLR